MDYIRLDGTWRLFMLPNVQITQEIFSVEQLAGEDGINASVPGNFELDLFKAGKGKDPYFGANIWDYYKYEDYHLFYHRKFSAEKNKRYELCFDGIDTFADVYLNGNKILHTDNMMIGYSVEVDDLHAENDLLVHIYPTMLEGRKHEYSMLSWQNTVYGQAGLYIRKAPYMFGWDILPRAVSGGIFKSCYLKERLPDKIKDVSYFVSELDYENKSAKIWFTYNTVLEDDRLYGQYTLEINGKCGDSVFSCEQDLWNTSGKFVLIPVEKCRFWYPKNYGEPDMYETVAILRKNGKEVDRFCFNVGIRKVEILRESATTEEPYNGKFGIRINGKDVFVLGTNWTPLDTYPSKNAERLPMMLDYMQELGCNAVRCWGGNLYESDEFFEFCDKHGIIVWQDFALACGLYPSDEEFCEQMRKEAKYIVKKLRNHPSLCIWAGDNECDLFCSWAERNPQKIRITREILPRVVDEEDFTTPYLPSSPYIDETTFKTKIVGPEGHNWWRVWIKGDKYKNDKACFQSEIGCQASPSIKSLKKYMSEESFFPWDDSELSKKYGVKVANREQAAHVPQMEQKPCCTTFILPKTDEYIQTMFGRQATCIDEYVKMSQIFQAEAFKYFIERMRIGKPEKTGIIWWNLFDGYPVHSNAVIDYYGEKKLAFHYIKRSQEPVAVIFDEPNNGTLAFHVVNDLQNEKVVEYKITDVVKGKTIAQDKCSVAANGNIIAGRVPESDIQTIYLIEYVVDGEKKRNHFTCNMPNIDFTTYIENIKKCGLYMFEGFDKK